MQVAFIYVRTSSIRTYLQIERERTHIPPPHPFLASPNIAADSARIFQIFYRNILSRNYLLVMCHKSLYFLFSSSVITGLGGPLVAKMIHGHTTKPRQRRKEKKRKLQITTAGKNTFTKCTTEDHLPSGRPCSCLNLF